MTRRKAPSPEPATQTLVRYEEERTADGGSSRIRDMLILNNMRAHWQLWLCFTTALNPFRTPRTVAMRRADFALCSLVTGEPVHIEPSALES